MVIFGYPPNAVSDIPDGEEVDICGGGMKPVVVGTISPWLILFARLRLRTMMRARMSKDKKVQEPIVAPIIAGRFVFLSPPPPPPPPSGKAVGLGLAV